MIMNCRKCKKTFKNIREYFKHRYQQCRPKTCPTCSQTFSSAASLFNHINHQQKVNCVHCNRRFCTNNELQRHLRSLRSISDDSIPDLNQRIYPETGYEDEENYQETINQKINVIHQDRAEKHTHYTGLQKKILKCAFDKNDCFYVFWDGESVSGIRFYPYDLDFPVPEVAIFPL